MKNKKIIMGAFFSFASVYGCYRPSDTEKVPLVPGGTALVAAQYCCCKRREITLNEQGKLPVGARAKIERDLACRRSCLPSTLFAYTGSMFIGSSVFFSLVEDSVTRVAVGVPSVVVSLASVSAAIAHFWKRRVTPGEELLEKHS